jgi:uncharacterized protein with GYD domain
MPKVGTGKDAKEFPYTQKGREDAKKEAEKTGKRMKISYATGGKVEMYQDQLRRKYHGK